MKSSCKNGKSVIIYSSSFLLQAFLTFSFVKQKNKISKMDGGGGGGGGSKQH